MVPTARGNNRNILPVGARGSVWHTEERRRRSFWGSVCGTASTASVAKCFGTYRYTQHRRRQYRSIPGNRGGNAEDTGGAAEAMLSNFTGAEKVYIACGYTDLRKGIDGLATFVQQQFELGPFTNALFLFCGRRREDRIKGLYWEGDGFILLYKRLERGGYQWPRNEKEVRRLTPQQYRWLMEGLKIEQPKAHCPVIGLSMV